MTKAGERLISAAKEMRRETILARVSLNGVSKRYVPKAGSSIMQAWAVYDQREGRFIPDDEIERIDPDEKMSLR